MLDCYKYGVYLEMKKTKDSISDDYEKPLFRRGWYIGFPGPGLSFCPFHPECSQASNRVGPLYPGLFNGCDLPVVPRYPGCHQ